MPFWFLIANSMVFAVGTQIAAGVFALRVTQTIRGRPTTVLDAVERAARRLPVLVAVAVVVGVTTGLGYELCWVPGAIANAFLAVAVPVSVLEHVGVVGSLERSAELTAGQRWPTFWALFAVVIPTVLLTIAVFVGVALASRILGVDTTGVRSFVLIPLVSPLTNGLYAVTATVLYYRLRIAREPLDSAQLARTFD